MGTFNYKSVQISMAGKVLGTAREFMTSESQDAETINVLGQSDPYAVVSKAKTFTGSLTFLAEEADSFIRSLPQGTSPLDVEITMVMLCVEPNTVPYSETLKGVRLTKWERKVTQGDSFIPVTVPFTFQSITRE